MDESRQGPGPVSTQVAADAVRAPSVEQPPSIDASSEPHEIIESVIEQVESMHSIAQQATNPNEPNVASEDFSELERQIQRLLSVRELRKRLPKSPSRRRQHRQSH